MTPIVISSNVSSLSVQKLQEKLEFLSYTFLVNADFTNKGGVTELVSDLEMYTLEALLRIFEKQLGYIPFQNKIYEKTEGYFGNQDAYNINRMMSSLRRAKLVQIDSTNTKYLKWMSNRIKYGIPKIISELNELGDMVRTKNDNVRTPATA